MSSRFFADHRNKEPNWRVDDDGSVWCLCLDWDGAEWVKQIGLGDGHVFLKDVLLGSDGKFIELPAPSEQRSYVMQTTTGDAW